MIGHEVLLANWTLDLSSVSIFVDDSIMRVFGDKVPAGEEHGGFVASMHFFGDGAIEETMVLVLSCCFDRKREDGQVFLV